MVSPSNVELLSKVLCAKAGEPPKAKRLKKRLTKKTAGFNLEST
jgi:hypothetical protein